VRVLLLPGAEQDLQDIRRHVVKKWGSPAWVDTLGRLRATVEALKALPLAGTVPEELADLGSRRYRQLVAGKHRLIYELTAEAIYIHIACDVRSDLRGLLSRRLLRVVS
jgi:toxin ParE1/3/4